MAQGWQACGEFIDRAQATDLRSRRAWRALLDQITRHRLDLILVWRIDRAFRSVLEAATTLKRLRRRGVGLRSYSEPWLDTTSPFGEALYYITAAYAQLERSILAERVRAGMSGRTGRESAYGDPAARESMGSQNDGPECAIVRSAANSAAVRRRAGSWGKPEHAAATTGGRTDDGGYFGAFSTLTPR